MTSGRGYCLATGLFCIVCWFMFGLTASGTQQRTRVIASGGNIAADPPRRPPAANPGVRAKLDHAQNVKDAARLLQLVAEVKQELETGGGFSISVMTLKKADEIQKLSKELNARLRRKD